MAIKDFSTKKTPAETIAEITNLLTPHGVKAILSEYDDNGNIVDISFKIRINQQDYAYRLPTDWQPIMKYFEQDKNMRREFCNEEQARRTAWRQIYHWIDAQMALVTVRMVSMDQIFLPYLLDKNGNTLYEKFQKSPQLLLGNGENNL